MDMRLVPVDQQVAVALRAGQQICHLRDKSLPLLGISPAEQLLGSFPGQVETVQGSPDRLATITDAEALAHPTDQAPQRPARCCGGTGYRGCSGCLPGGTDDDIQFGCDVRAKGGRPPVR
jgi:hypothetical protein